MFEAAESPYLVTFDGSFRVDNAPTTPPDGAPDEQALKDALDASAEAGTMILKFWLNVSRDEQRKRFLSRLDEPEKHWKFSLGDIRERRCWDDYMSAYEDALNRTSRAWAPWYAIPADDKDFMRMTVADIVVDNLEACGLAYPVLSDEARSELEVGRRALEAD